LHVVYHLLSGPKRHSELKSYLAGVGNGTLSDRLRSLSANQIISRIAGPAPGSEICYQLTERGLQLAPVIAALSTWGLDILTGDAPGGADDDEVTFGQEWTIGDPGTLPSETYQWRIDGSEFTLSVLGSELVRRRGRVRRPAAELVATKGALASLVRGETTLTAAAQKGEISLQGSRSAISRMFTAVGFPQHWLEPVTDGDGAP